MEYTIKIFPDPEEDGDYIAEVEELYGCSAFGESPEITLREIETACNSGLKLLKNMESRFLYQKALKQKI